MKIADILKVDEAEFVFSSLNIDNYNCSYSSLRFWFEHCNKKFEKISGDIFEFGVFQGRSLIAMALLLKKLGSDKKVIGFDSFSGFPGYHENDDLDTFYRLQGSTFELEQVDRVRLLRTIKEKVSGAPVDAASISASRGFAETSLEMLKSRIRFFELDNIVLVPGDFSVTVPEFFESWEGSIFSCNLDCDLYMGYKVTLPFIWKHLEKGGYVHLDEYYSLKFPGAKIACDEFFDEMGISPEKQPVRTGEFERWCLRK